MHHNSGAPFLQADDILTWAAQYDGEPFHALLCDPPYHLTEMTRRFGGANATPAQYGSDGAFQRASKGFMGKTWDGGDVAFRPETWAALAQHLYPGAFGMAFASSRGWHRLAVAIEDAGLIIHPTIFCWAYGSGFPKATRIDTQIDRRAGAQRRVVGRRKHAPKFAAAELGYREKDNGYNAKDRKSFNETAPATEQAAAWQGHRYGLQALKPAVEPIIVFQRPYDCAPVESITATGAGALNIDAGRIGRATDDRFEYGVDGDERGNANSVYSALGAARNEPHQGGRWPANLALVHHPACNGVCHPDCAVRRLGEQSGERSSRPGNTPSGAHQIYNGGWIPRSPRDYVDPDDSGTAARFFRQISWMADRLEAADQLGYFAKASCAEREAGLDPLQIALVRQLYGDDLPDFDETTVDDGRETPIDNAYLRGETTRRNTHPTIKPIALTRWLASLLLPPSDYAPRRLLVPFAGTGSEIIGALLAGWEAPYGVELDAQHVAIGQARLRYWQQQQQRFGSGQPIRLRVPRKEHEAPTLFDGLWERDP